MMNNMMADMLFGGSSSFGTGSIFSSSNFGDLALMKNGVYKKMIRSYYEKVEGSSDTKKETTNQFTNVRDKVAKEKENALKISKENEALSSMKSTAKSLETNAKSLAGMDFDGSTKEEIYSAVKKMADSYNSVVDSAGKTGLTSISQSVKWMTDSASVREKQLKKLGITVGTNGKLSIDEEKFKAANLTDIKSLMAGKSSYVSGLAQRATGLYNLASNQMSTSAGKTLYSSSGVLK